MSLTRKFLIGWVVVLACTGLTLVALRPAYAATLTEVTNFGTNPGGMRMHVYVPDARPANPAIVVAMHGCGGTAKDDAWSVSPGGAHSPCVS